MMPRIKILALAALGLALAPSLSGAAPITTPWIAPGGGISGSSKILGAGSSLNGKTLLDLMNQVDANQTTANAAIPKSGNMDANGTIIAPTVAVIQTSDAQISVTPSDADSAVYVVTPAAATTITFASGSGSGRAKRITVIIQQPSTGGYTVSFSGNIAWPNGAQIVPSSVAGDKTVITFITTDGGTSYIGGI